MRERPIVFGPESVRSILAGRKTQTRRVVRLNPAYLEMHCSAGADEWQKNREALCSGSLKAPMRCPHGAPGDRLWVKEAWTRWCSDKCDRPGHVAFRADASREVDAATRWTSPLLMPRWASRLTLEVTAVRVERVQDISEADAVAEGVPDSPCAVIEYGRAWDAINAKRGFPWSSNPWVWAVTFKRVEGSRA